VVVEPQSDRMRLLRLCSFCKSWHAGHVIPIGLPVCNDQVSVGTTVIVDCRGSEE
jgi:hypothetical protein